MSDLAATNCGNGCGCGCATTFNGGGCNDACSIIWIILLLSCFCGGNGSFFGRDNDGCGCGNNSCIWIILLLLFCGGNNGSFFGGNGCGCNNFGCGC